MIADAEPQQPVFDIDGKRPMPQSDTGGPDLADPLQPQRRVMRIRRQKRVGRIGSERVFGGSASQAFQNAALA